MLVYYTLPPPHTHTHTYTQEGKSLGQSLLAHLPHIVPFRRRVSLFRECVQRDKQLLGVTEAQTPTYVVGVSVCGCVCVWVCGCVWFGCACMVVFGWVSK